MMAERIAAAPHHQMNIRIGAFLTVKINGRTGTFQHLRDSGNRKQFCRFPRQNWAHWLGRTRKSAHDGAIRDRRTRACRLIASAEAAAGKANLTQYSRERNNHPRSLFTVLCTLHAVAKHNHCAVCGQVLRKGTDLLRWHTRDLSRPLRRLFHAVLFTQEVFLHLLPAGAVFGKKRMIGLAGHFELIHHRSHQRTVGARIRRDPFRIHIGCGIRHQRVNGIGLDALLFKSAEITSMVVQRRSRIDVRCHERIAGPKDDTFRVLQNHFISRHARIGGADNIRHDRRMGCLTV